MKRYLLCQNKPTGVEYLSYDLKKNTNSNLLAYEFGIEEVSDQLKILNAKTLKKGDIMYIKKEAQLV